MKKIITFFVALFILLAGSVQAAIKTNDPYLNNQWYLSKIKADSAWEKVAESPDTVIAVIDSGIQINHPDLKNNIWLNQKEISGDNLDNDNNGFIDDISGWDFVTNVPDASPKFSEGWTEAGISHGTMIAGIIAAQGNNNKGVAGVTWRAQIMPLKALSDKGEGRIGDVIRAIDYATNNGADIINLSFTSLNYSDGLQEAIYRAHNAGVIVVAAAGNEQAAGEGYNIDKTKIYPACYDGLLIGENMVIGVAATDALDQKTNFSSYGFACVDIAAPGISFFNTATNGHVLGANVDYDGYWSGTSMATPLVTATLALIQQANPELNKREVVNILLASADNINLLNPNYLGQLGNGRVNVNSAVEMAKSELYSRISRLVVSPVLNKEDVVVATVNGNKIYNFNTDILQSGISFAIGDINGDGEDEIVVGSLPGASSTIKVLDKEGALKSEFLVGDKNFIGGLNISLVDLNEDGRQEIAVVPASLGKAEVKIYDYRGSLVKSFIAVAGNWRGGLNIASGDLDGRGRPEIVVSFTAGHEPQVRMFNNEGKLLGVFLAYEKSFRGGVNIAVANLDGRKDKSRAEIIVSPGPGREPQIKIFNNYAQLKNQFFGYNKNWHNGVNVSAGDTNNDGIAEIILGAYPGGASHVRVFDMQGLIIESFYAWPESFTGGVKAGIIKINN